MTFISVYFCVKDPRLRDINVNAAGAGSSDNITIATVLWERLIGW